MRISTIPQIYRNLRRWNEIIAVLRRYGLADGLSHVRVNFLRSWIKDDDGTPLADYSRPTRVRLALMELGPTFIKLGQILSLRPDIVGSEMATELQLLQSETTSDSFETVRGIVESELDGKLESLFEHFESTPIASASIGQVHVARLHDGASVVVKVQHENIQKKVREDLAILAGMATLANRVPEFSAWQPSTLVEQLSRTLSRELSFQNERRNIQLFGKELRKHKDLIIPEPNASLSTDRVLTMEHIGGCSIKQLVDDQPNSLLKTNANDAENILYKSRFASIAQQLANLYIDMIFRIGIYHADPHPGNIRILGEDQLALLDFGMIGRIDDRLREIIEDMLMAIASGDSRLLTTLIKRAGRVPPTIDESALTVDVTEFVGTYGCQPLESFDLSGALSDITDIMHRHHIMLPPSAGMLIKTLVTLEGTIRSLNPPQSLIEMVLPAFRKLHLRRYSPRRQLKKFRGLASEAEDVIERLPSQITGVMDLLQKGRLDIRLTHRGLSPSINRLVLGLLTSSLLLGSAILLANRVPPLLFTEPSYMGLHDISLIGAIGFLISAIVSLRLLHAINRSGHLDPGRDTD